MMRSAAQTTWLAHPAPGHALPCLGSLRTNRRVRRYHPAHRLGNQFGDYAMLFLMAAAANRTLFFDWTGEDGTCLEPDPPPFPSSLW